MPPETLMLDELCAPSSLADAGQLAALKRKLMKCLTIIGFSMKEGMETKSSMKGRLIRELWEDFLLLVPRGHGIHCPRCPPSRSVCRSIASFAFSS